MKAILSYFFSVVVGTIKNIIFLLIAALTLLDYQTKADPVSDWNATAVAVQLRVPALSKGLVDLTYLHIAIYDAVNAIDGGYSVFKVSPPNKV